VDVLIDIETLPIDARVGMDLDIAPGWAPVPPRVERKSPPRNWKDEAKIQAKQRELDEDYQRAVEADLTNQRTEALEDWRRSVFRWDRARIGCIGVFAGGSASTVYDCEDIGERAALLRFMDELPPRGRILTWGDYDARILRSRLLHYGIEFGPLGVSAKPWDRRVVNLQRLFADVVEGNPSKIKGISVDAACDFLGIDRADNPIHGRDVLDRYVSGDWGDVIAHCRADVIDEWKVWDRLVGVGCE